MIHQCIWADLSVHLSASTNLTIYLFGLSIHLPINTLIYGGHDLSNFNNVQQAENCIVGISNDELRNEMLKYVRE